MTRQEDAVLRLLSKRAPDATICPSEAAREIAGEDDDWRLRMDDVHCAVDRLVEEGRIRLSWKGAALERRDGPYRIARAKE
ncbi:DUF3253 domain-containing protein [Erythrobacter sp. SD-21]|uniref:DUF3253 domain-containing protein n=1 Tax=Erythrobacter sp. SD-21 TaxID=161528 RepID=UPI000153EF8A|nr:DUF3253 domain-containing protein [Erythrobacter sp. SD-21]EDL49240.1 hypothetical protein ED21_21209 [Erythrobacter sp. SD-21]